MRELTLLAAADRAKVVIGLEPTLEMLEVCSAARAALGLPAPAPGTPIKENLRTICRAACIETGWDTPAQSWTEVLKQGDGAPLQPLQAEIEQWQPQRWGLEQVIGAGGCGVIVRATCIHRGRVARTSASCSSM
jgi:hypothetical protein